MVWFVFGLVGLLIRIILLHWFYTFLY